MKIFKIIILIFILFTAKTSFANELYKTEINWYKISALKIFKWSWYKVIAWVSTNWESLDSLVKKYNWVSWVNWAYFHPADYGWVNESNAYRISNWTKYAKWDETWASNVVFAFDKNWIPFLFQNAHDYSTWRWDIYMTGRTINIDKEKEIHNGIWNFPLLLKDWVNMLDKELEISEKMKAKSLKNFICSSKDWNTIYMWNIENPNIRAVPDILSKLGCHNAINLDAGGSSAMIYNNKYIRGPGRNIMDAFIIIKDENSKTEVKTTSDEEKKKEAIKKLILEKVAKEKETEIIKQNILKKYSLSLDKAFKKIENKISTYTKEKQLEFLNNLKNKIEKLLQKQNLSLKNKTILEYFKNLITNKITTIN